MDPGLRGEWVTAAGAAPLMEPRALRVQTEAPDKPPGHSPLWAASSSALPGITALLWGTLSPL